MSKTSATSSGHILWSKIPKANAELFALTYGALVTELIRDYDNDPAEVNAQLEKIGHSIGVRCVDEFLSKADMNGISISTCKTMRDTADVISKIGFRMFLGVSAEVGNFSTDGRSFSLFLTDNPLSIFVELPESHQQPSEGVVGSENNKEKLLYSNIYCGLIRGALQQVNLRVECKFLRDVLLGEEVNEIKVELKEVLMDGAGDDYKEE